MRVAVESAALALRHELACRIQTTSPNSPISNLQISNPPQISSQRPRAFRPAVPKHAPTWFLWFSKNNSQCRARSKKLMLHRHWCEFASKMQATSHHFHNFYVPTHFSHHIFSKKCFSPQWGAHFRKTTSSTFDHFFHFFPRQTASKRAFFPIVFALFALLAAPIPIFSLFEPFGILIFAYYLCIFSLRSPVSKNDRMHHTYIFVNFVAIDASLHHTCKLHDIFSYFSCSNSLVDSPLFKSMLPAAVGSTFSQNEF